VSIYKAHVIAFFGLPNSKVFAVQTHHPLSPKDQEKLIWLFGNAPLISKEILSNAFIGPRASMVTPWSTNAVEITQNMGIEGIVRMEEFFAANSESTLDPMLSQNTKSSIKLYLRSTSNPKPLLKLIISRPTISPKAWP
jgi:phosphoribosylformylglycinamidine synthase